MKITKEKAEYLESLGFTIVESIEVDGYTTEFHFYCDDNKCALRIINKAKTLNF